MLISATSLASRLGEPDLVVLDCTVQYNGSERVSGLHDFVTLGHVPGARFADLLGALSDPGGRYGFTRPSADRFANAVGALGVGDDSTVVVYDDSTGFWATRVWWLFRAFGFDRVSLLDGGLTAWKASGLPVAIGPFAADRAVFTPRPRPELFVARDDVLDVVAGRRDAALVSALPPADHSGAESPRDRPGHIPGATNLPAGSLVSSDYRLLPLSSLSALAVNAVGATGEAPEVVAYCGGGISATLDAFVLTLLGYENVTVYDGSLNEWSDDPSLPLVTD